MKYNVVLFDFDGTIADTQDVALNTLNALSREFGYEPISEKEFPTLRTYGARELLVKRLGIPLWNLWKIYRLEKRGRAEFRSRSAGVKAFPGISQLLIALRVDKYKVGIVTSNEAPIVRRVLKAASADIDILDTDSAVMSKSRAIKRTLRAHKLDPKRVVYVGDELRDVDACRKAGIDMIGVGWGYNGAEALKQAGTRVADAPAEVVRLLEGSK